MVGASGSLLATKHGALIDAHQQVIRINHVANNPNPNPNPKP